MKNKEGYSIIEGMIRQSCDLPIKQKYNLIDWDKPQGHEIANNKPILMSEDEARDLNKLLTLNGENKRYVKEKT